MKIICRFALFSILFNNVPVYSQQPDEIEIMAEAILTTMAEDNIFPENDFFELKEILLSNTESIFGKAESTPNVRTKKELINHLLTFEADKFGVNTDSALTLFVDWYLHLQRIFYQHNKQYFFNSSKPKILFFGTTVSCHCTLEMCKEQLIDILKLKKDKEEYSFLIVDAFWNNELQKEYNTLFTPSVLVFDDENNLQLKIEYKENMIDTLLQYLNKI